MKRTRILKINSRAVLFLFFIIFLTPGISSGVNLMAIEGTWGPPEGGNPIKMWGFVEDQGSCQTLPINWETGPQITGNVGENLTITLRNCLSEPVSLIIPGLPGNLRPQTFIDSQGRTRVRAFTKEVPADNGKSTVTYTWTNLREGSYLYMSGSQPAKQVHMGMYGVVTVGKHKDASFATTVLFSEIDPALHETAEASTPLNYKPKYFLINGEAARPGFPPPFLDGGKHDKTTQLRFLNAGLMTHIPTIQGPYMTLYAEDGNQYPYPKERYSVILPAGKTIDALWSPGSSQHFKLYDRRLSLTNNKVSGGGMIQQFQIRGFPWMMFVPAIDYGAQSTP